MSIYHSKERQDLEALPQLTRVHSKSYGVHSFGLPRRYTRLVFFFLLSAGIWFAGRRYLDEQNTTRDIEYDVEISYPQVQEVANSTENELPPLFESYRQYEDEISQRNLDIQNTPGQYLFFANQAHGCGWGNVLQEVVFNSLIASEAKLGYVWDDYTWSREGDYAVFKGKKIPSRIPISTLLAGHLVGLSHGGTKDRPLPYSISSRTYNKICPVHERRIINRDMVQSYLTETGSPTPVLAHAPGEEVLDAWVKYLGRPELREARCIEVQRDTIAVFDIWLFGSTRIHSLWKKLSKAPVIQHWQFSPLIHGIFKKNVALFSSRRSSITNAVGNWLWTILGSSRDHARATRDISCVSHNSSCRPDPRALDHPSLLPILVLHLRRGDFEEHCLNLAEWGSTFTGFNSFPEFEARDNFTVPTISEFTKLPNEVTSLAEKQRLYTPRCFPDAPQIVRKVREVVHDYVNVLEGKEKGQVWWARRKVSPQDRLKKIYIMTNGDAEWLAGVKKALLEDVLKTGEPSTWNFAWSWEGISTSRDLKLGWEEKPVAQALDSYVASRAELFVGNGFSSLTSNIVMLRKKNQDLDPVQTRFW